MDYDLRPYSKTIFISNASRYTIDLTDSNGDLLDCNFIDVSTSAGDTNGLLKMDLHISGLTTTVENTSSAADLKTNTDVNLSGFCGLLMKTTQNFVDKVANITLSDADRVNRVTFQFSENDSLIVFLTYGQKQLGNPLRKNLRSKGS